MVDTCLFFLPFILVFPQMCEICNNISLFFQVLFTVMSPTFGVPYQLNLDGFW